MGEEALFSEVFDKSFEELRNFSKAGEATLIQLITRDTLLLFTVHSDP